jgi:hypothetical protein
MMDAFAERRESILASQIAKRDAPWLERLFRVLDGLERSDPDWSNTQARADALKLILPLVKENNDEVSFPVVCEQAEDMLLLTSADLRRELERRQRVVAARAAADLLAAVRPDAVTALFRAMEELDGALALVDDEVDLMAAVAAEKPVQPEAATTATAAAGGPPAAAQNRAATQQAEAELQERRMKAVGAFVKAALKLVPADAERRAVDRLMQSLDSVRRFPLEFREALIVAAAKRDDIPRVCRARLACTSVV